MHTNNGRCVGNINIVHRHRAGILQSSKTEKVNGSGIGHEHITNDDISSANNRNATKANAKKYNTTKVDEFDKRIHFTQSKRAAESPVFLFPWSLWMKIRSAAYHNNEVDTRSENSITTKQKPKRRWEIPLTSRPFQGVEDLRSTVVRCIVAIVIYFIIGAVAFPLWLERKLLPLVLEIHLMLTTHYIITLSFFSCSVIASWSLIDGMYFAMASITTVGYGDVVVNSGPGIRATIAKLFVLSFNIYAVCISVSALGIIAKLALAQEKKIMARAKERARQQFIHMFDIEEDKDSAEEDEEDDDEQCSWAEKVIDDKNKCDMPDNPRSIIGALQQSLQNNLFNFIVLGFIAALLKRVEGWSLIDILYYWNCTATTIGFGDVCPTTQIGRLLAIVFIPLSVVTLGETIASVFAFVNARLAAKAEKDFLRREITLSDLDYLDVNDDGKVCELDFITFMLVAMQKVDSKTMKDLQHLFRALDAGKDGYLQKEDLIELRQRKRLSKRLIRDAKKNKLWFETKLTKGFSPLSRSRSNNKISVWPWSLKSE